MWVVGVKVGTIGILVVFVCLFFAQQPPVGQGLLIHEVSRSQRRTTVGRTLLDEWSARRRDLYLTTNNTPNRQTSMPPVGFETTIPQDERSQTHTINCAATGTRILVVWNSTNKIWWSNNRIIDETDSKLLLYCTLRYVVTHLVEVQFPMG
jgi:hypothetical protein